jgi:hypothetical protein
MNPSPPKWDGLLVSANNVANAINRGWPQNLIDQKIDELIRYLRTQS